MASNLRKPLLVDQYVPPHECGIYCATGGVCSLPCLSVCPETCKYSSAPADKDFSGPHGQHHGLSLWFTLSLVALATFFFFFTCYTAYRIYSTWYTRRRTSPAGDDPGPDAFLQDEEQGPVVDHPIWYIRTIGLQRSVISAITVVKYKKGDGLIDGSDCAICLNEFEEDESLRLLPKCSHAFHIPCIDTWLRSHTNCPMCRAGIETLKPTAPNPGVVDEDGRELRSGDSELRIVIDDAGNESRSQIGLTNNEDLVGGEGRNRDAGDGLNGEQPMRRSVSVDSFSASPITASIANAAHLGQLQLVDHEKDRTSSGVVSNKSGINQSLLRFVGSFSMERSTQMETPSSSSSSIKRSLSCSAKVLLSRHSSRSHDFGLPPRNEPLHSLEY